MMQRQYKNRGKRSGEKRWRRKKKRSFFLNMSKTPRLIRLNHGSTGDICISVLFSPAQTVGLASGLSDPLTFTQGPITICKTRMCSSWGAHFKTEYIFQTQYYAMLCYVQNFLCVQCFGGNLEIPPSIIPLISGTCLLTCCQAPPTLTM